MLAEPGEECGGGGEGRGANHLGREIELLDNLNLSSICIIFVIKISLLTTHCRKNVTKFI